MGILKDSQPRLFGTEVVLSACCGGEIAVATAVVASDKIGREDDM